MPFARPFSDNAMLIRERAMRNEIRVHVPWELDMMHPWKFGIGRCEVSDCEPSVIGALSSRERLGGFVWLSSIHLHPRHDQIFATKVFVD